MAFTATIGCLLLACLPNLDQTSSPVYESLQTFKPRHDVIEHRRRVVEHHWLHVAIVRPQIGESVRVRA